MLGTRPKEFICFQKPMFSVFQATSESVMHVLTAELYHEGTPLRDLRGHAGYYIVGNSNVWVI